MMQFNSLFLKDKLIGENDAIKIMAAKYKILYDLS